MGSLAPSAESSSTEQMMGSIAAPESSSTEQMMGSIAAPESSSTEQATGSITPSESSPAAQAMRSMASPESSSSEQMVESIAPSDSLPAAQAMGSITSPESSSSQQMMESIAPSESSSAAQAMGLITPSESSPETEIPTMTTVLVADREVCDICCGPLKGHHSRMIPCNHAIYPPCVDNAQQQSSQQDDYHVGDKAGDNQSSQLLTCDVCDDTREAECLCVDCGKHLCFQCRHYHAKFTSSHQLQPSTSSTRLPSKGDLDPDLEERIRRQVEDLTAALSLMEEERSCLQRERQAVVDVISSRADAVRALVTQAEERCHRTLAEVAEKREREIEEEMTAARDRRHQLQKMSLKVGNKQTTDVHTSLFSEDNVLYQPRQPRFLLHQSDDPSINLQVVECYLGQVYDTSSSPREAGEDKGVVTDGLPGGQRAAGSPTPATELSTGCAPHLRQSEGEKNSVQQHLDAFSRGAVKIEEETVRLQEQVRNMLNMLDTIRGLNSKLPSGSLLCQDAETMTEGHIELQEKEVHSDGETGEQHEEISGEKEGSGTESSPPSSNTEIIKGDNATIPKEIGALSQMFTTLKSKSRHVIVFHARLRAERLVREKVLVRHEVRCNVGQAYNTRTGVFTAPVTGIYLFLATELKGSGTGGAATRLSVDNTTVTWFKSRLSHVGKEGVSCTSHVAVRLTSGQRVSLKARTVSVSQTWLLLFSGMLVQI